MSLTSFPIPTVDLEDLSPSEFPLAALQFAPNQAWNPSTYIGHNAYHGPFYTASQNPGSGFWEAWVCPEYGAEYVISAGYGGSHPVLFGFDGAGSGKLGLTGNIYNGTTNVSFSSVDKIDPNTWHHIAVGIDEPGKDIYVYLDGVLTGQVTNYSGTRQASSTSADQGLYIGGSDHSNFKGKILRVRGFENQIPFTSGVFPGAFRPETVFGSTWNDQGSSTSEYKSQFCTDYSRRSEVLPDFSSGYNSSTHAGKRAIGSYGGQASSDSKLPQWVLANFVKPSYLGSQESIPGGANIFDDFSRANETFAWAGNENSEYPYVGVARTGQSWVGTSGGAPAGQPDMGILEGAACAVGASVSGGASCWIDSNQTNGTIVIDRFGSGAISAILRRADANNYYMVSLSSTAVETYKRVAGSGPTLVSTLTAPGSALWTRATITFTGTSITVALTGTTGGGASTIDAALTGEEVGFATAGVGRVKRFLFS